MIRAPAAALAALALAGCAPVSLGPDPDFLWWSDHETGDLADWTRGGDAEGASYESGGGAVAVVTGLARSGHYALVSTTPAAGAAGTTAGQVTRKTASATGAYFGAWFYVPAVARPATYWVFFSFHAAGGAALWDLKLAPDGAGGLALQLLHHDTGDVAPLRLLTVPIGRWFQVQASYRALGDAGDALRVWQDDAPIFEVSGADAAGAGGVQWTLGSITDGLQPGPVSLLVDDAFIATRRIAADAPRFWRP
jgi:hypothetical protein